MYKAVALEKSLRKPVWKTDFRSGRRSFLDVDVNGSDDDVFVFVGVFERRCVRLGKLGVTAEVVM